MGKKMLASWQKTKKSQKILIIAVIALSIVALCVVVTMANQVEYETLFTGLNDEEAGTVVTELETMGIDVKSLPGGTLMVPKGQRDELKYKLQAQGIPAGDTLDYDLYSTNAGAFGSTDKDKAYYEQAQLQQNLSLIINQMDKIKSSTVLLSLADKSGFVLSDDSNPNSTAAVMVVLKSSSDMLSQSDVDAIRAIVTKSVPSLTEENISVVDQNMHSYGSGSASSGVNQVDTQVNLQQKVASDLEQQIVNLLSPVFGPENLSASVNVTLNFDKTTTNSLTLTPPTNDAENMGIITSMKQTEERLQNGGTTPEGEPGQDPNGGAPTYQEIDDAAQDSTYYQTVNEVNAEVNEISQQIEEAQGDITELSATLIINGDDSIADVLPQVRQQIATAIGVSEDKITVSSMPFTQNTLYQQALEEQAAAMEQQQRSEMLQTLIPPIAIVAGILILLLVIMSNRRKRREQELEEQRMQEWSGDTTGQHIDVAVDDELSVEELLKKDDNTLGQIQGLVDKDPDAIAQLLRNWLSDDF